MTCLRHRSLDHVVICTDPPSRWATVTALTDAADAKTKLLNASRLFTLNHRSSVHELSSSLCNPYEDTSAMTRPVIHYFIMPNTRSDRLFWVLEVGTSPSVADKRRSWESPTMYLLTLQQRGDSLRRLLRWARYVRWWPGLVSQQSPVLEMDGKVQSESGSIVLGLLASKHVTGLEQQPSPQSIYWSHFAEGTMMLHLQPARVLGIYTDVISKRLSPEAAKGARTLNDMFRSKWADHNVQLQLDAVEAYLKENKYFTGTQDIGLGDVSAPPVATLMTDNDALPHHGGVGRVPQRRVQHWA